MRLNSVIVLSILLGACASIVGERTQLIPVSSTPDEADIFITDETGANVFRGKTPTTVTLPKSDGSYWGKKSFSVRISKPGFETRAIPLKASANGWYIAGNLIFGGLIGWFIVDPLNGAMYTLSPGEINTDLTGTTTFLDNTGDGRISIVLVRDVSPLLREKMTRVD